VIIDTEQQAKMLMQLSRIRKIRNGYSEKFLINY